MSILDPSVTGYGPRGPSCAGAPFSFLFVVNELEFYRDPGADIFRDTWHNDLPPRYNVGYTDERIGSVLRYRDGKVTEALGHVWYRNSLRQRGFCYSNFSDSHFADVYSESAVFSCNPHLPLVVIPRDPLTLADAKSFMHALHFFHPRHLPGVSQATTPEAALPLGGAPVKYVAGKNPSWMPSLVPSVYANPWLDLQPSRGLGGELAIIIGLMAFSKNGSNVDEVFLGGGSFHGRWRSGYWTGVNAPSYYPRSTQETPRGFYIGIFIDPENVEGSSRARIHSFEWDSAIIHETPNFHELPR